jgi:hypothetical protein
MVASRSTIHVRDARVGYGEEGSTDARLQRESDPVL